MAGYKDVNDAERLLQEEYCAGIPRKGYIVLGCWEPKRKFRLKMEILSKSKLPYSSHACEHFGSLSATEIDASGDATYHYQNGLVVAALMILIAAICFSRLHQLPCIRATVYNESDPRVFEAAVLPGFIQQSPKAPKLVAFRQHTAPLVTDTDDELSRIVAVQHWVRGQESDKQFYRQAGQEPGPEVDNTEEPQQYLEQQHRGIPSACRRFSYILTGALLSVGINARVVSVAESLNQSAGLAAHNLVEVWVQKFHKWILVDPTIDAFVLVNGTPASLLEVYVAAQPESHARISFDQHGSHYRIGPVDKYRRYFRHLFVARTNAIFDGYHYGLFGARRIEFAYYLGPGIEPYPQRKKEWLLLGFAGSICVAAVLILRCGLQWIITLLRSPEVSRPLIAPGHETLVRGRRLEATIGYCGDNFAQASEPNN